MHRLIALVLAVAALCSWTGAFTAVRKCNKYESYAKVAVTEELDPPEEEEEEEEEDTMEEFGLEPSDTRVYDV